jgi:putative membrane protein
VAEEKEEVDRRTGLAGERTLLAWWRTGFTAIAVALGVGRVVPELAPHATRWPYAVLGVGFAFYGIAMIGYGTRRMMELDREVGGAPPDRRAARTMWGLAGVGVVLGVATVALILAQ